MDWPISILLHSVIIIYLETVLTRTEGIYALLDFPGNRSEVMECIDREVIPTNVIDVMPADQVPFKTHEQFRDENWPFVNDHRQVMEYFPHRSVVSKMPGTT